MRGFGGFFVVRGCFVVIPLVVSQTEREAIAARRSASGFDGYLRSDAEDAFDKKPLPNYVAFRQPADLTFANDVHGLVSRDRTQRAVHRAESLILLGHKRTF